MNTIIDSFEAQVRSKGDAIALRDPAAGKTATYRQLDEQARRIAGRLVQDGLRKGEAVIVIASRGVGFVAAMLGVMMAGGAYVPLSDHYPEERLDYIAGDCGARFRIDDAWLAGAMETAPLSAPVAVGLDDTALFAYTSGSTGKPKGVRHVHRGVAEAVERYRAIIGQVDDSDVYGLAAPFYFIVHVRDVFVCLAHGIEAVIIPDAIRGDPEGLADFIDAHQIAMAYISPKVLRFFHKKGDSLKTVFAGSERISRIGPAGFRLVAMYGSTETVGAFASFEVDREYDNTPIGRPGPNSAIYLMDEDGHFGDEGEICVAGHMGQCYLNLPQKSAETFTPNPFREKDGFELLIHTGDLGRRLPDGNFLYINRRDWMIKINGQRVEPGEIEAEIRRLDGVTDAVVRDFTDAAGLTFLTAYCITAGEMDEDGMKAALSKVLPDYMIPSVFVRLERFPVNANGKLDRGALPMPERDRKRAAYAAPENDAQRHIVEACEAVLGLGHIGIDDDFFALGGDSIKVMMLQKALRERGVSVSASAIFEAHTPRRLSENIGSQSDLQRYQGRAADAYPLTRAQMSIYLDCQMKGISTAYNNITALFLPSDMNADAGRLRRCAEEVLNSYPILNTVTRTVDGVPSLAPLKDAAIAVRIIDADTDDRNALAQRLNGPFDLENEPPCRAAVYRMAGGLFLVLVMHHIVCDGTTMSIVTQNIAAAFDGRPLRREAMSNLTLAQYECEHPEAAEADNQVYRQMLDGIEGDIELYADDAPGMKEKAGQQSIYNAFLSEQQAGLSGTLRAKLSEIDATENSLFMSAYACMLSLLSGQRGALFFTGENGRHDPILENTVGMMVHAVPVYVKIDGGESCAEFIRKNQSMLFSLIAHDGADFAALYGEYGINPGYGFVYQGEMLSTVELGGRIIPIELYKSEEAMSTLTLHVFKREDGDYQFQFRYASDFFTETSIALMARLYTRIVAGLCESATLDGMRLVDDDALSLMDAANATAADYPVRDIVTMFREAAERYPDNAAVIFKDKTFTYRQVDDISERVAHHLRAQGVGRGDVVSILIPRCEWMTLASLGALKAGAAYQPLDPSYPPERLAFMMKDADCRLLIADEALLERVPEYGGPVLLTKDIPALPACEKLNDHPDPEDLFILLYTSGSTGVPKGVMLEHRNIANFCQWYRDYYALDQTCRVAAYASYGFDANMMDQYPALTTGACICIAEEEIRLDLIALEDWYNRLGITHSFITTQVGRQFYANMNPASLRHLSVGGEKLVPVAPVEGKPVLYNGYGPTECTIFSTIAIVERLYERVPIGKPLNNYRVYVVDKNLRRLPPLAPGELLIAGRGVGRGYLNRPDLTEKAFIKNPFSDDPDYARAYRTGDVVRLLPDGSIDFIGRNDGQVKVRGFRIELTEVEGVIRDFPGIRDATVQAFEDSATGEKFIAAYVVSDAEVDVDALNRFIEQQKPPYMVPAVTMQIPAIPLNQNQKVNKKALPEPILQQEDIVPPQNEAQQRVFDCVAEVIGHKGFGVTTNLYDAGLSSIGMIRLNVLLSRAFDVPVSISDLREHRTIVELEAFLAGQKPQETYAILPDYPLTQTQSGILVESLAYPNTTIYNIPTLFRLSDRVDPLRLKAAVEAAIAAHPCLNAEIFTNASGELRVRRNDGAAPVVEIVETPSLPEELVRPFEMMKGRLYRANIYITEAGNYLFLDFHHIIYDGSSSVVFLQDIESAYKGDAVEAETYTGFEAALDEERLRGTDRYEQAKGWFDALLAEADREMLPDGDVDGEEHTSSRLDFDTALDAGAVDAFCKAHDLSENAFFNAAFAFVLSRFTGKSEALYTTVYNGRNDSRLTRAVTMLVKTFPVMMLVKPEQAIADFASDLSKQLVGSMSNDLYAFAEIAQAHGIASDILFVYQGDSFEFDTIGGEKAERIPLRLDETKAPIALQVLKVDGRYNFVCDYRSDRYSESYMRVLAGCLEKAAAEFTTRRTLGDVSLLTSALEAEIEKFNATEKPYPARDIVSMFREAVEQYSDNTAVIFKDKTCTYRQADDISERIAHHLRAQGVGRGDVVSILIPRCEWMTLASLGALKAGAAYQPLDPSYPPERLAFMMKDADCRLLIADEALLELVPEYKGPVLLTKDIPALPACEKLNDHPDPEDLFILLYTSGSTGVPKGVMLEHRNIANFCQWYRDYYVLDQTCRVAAYASYGFDANMMDQYPALTTGACVCIVEEEIRLDLIALEAWCNRLGITHSFITTQVGRQFYANMNPASLRHLSVGGEKLVPVAPVEGKPVLYNGYGPTECTIFSTIAIVERLYERVPIGKPLNNYRVYVVDKNLRRLPLLAPGELLISGRGVGRGYLNRPDLTEKAFIKNPFSDDPDYVRAYRTGDVVRLLPDGSIDFIGRNDGQVKVRGFRIELPEVEGVIRDFPGIRDATVQAFEDSATGEKFIAAYVVSDAEVDVDALNRFIEQQKPPYMVPAVTMQIPAIPLNQNQKVNKKALPKPEPKPRSKRSEGAATPLNVLEQALKDIVAEIVNTDDFGITDRFGDLGLTSISSIRLAVQLQKRYGIQVNARELVSEGTLQGVENAILETMLTAREAPATPAAAEKMNEPAKRSCRLSFAQQGVFAECQANPESVVYNVPFMLKLPEGIDAAQLRSAVSHVVEAHPYILCHFVPNEDNEIIQEPIPDCVLDIPVREMSAAEFEAYKPGFVRPFDLAKGPVVRFEIVKADALYLLADLHHLVADGASADIFFRQLCQALDGAAIERESYSYYDFVAEEKIEPGVEDFFAGRMAEMEEATQLIPDVFEAGLPHSERSVCVPTDIAAVKAFAREHGMTPAAVYLAAAYIAYGRYVCEDTVAIATISNGRSNLKLSETMGMFVNTLPLVVSLDHKEETLSFLRRVAKDFSDTIAHENYPFARIASRYDFHPMASYTYQIGVISEYRTQRGPIEISSFELDAAKVAVGVYIEGAEDAAQIKVSYDSALYSEAMMRGLAESIDNAVRGLLTAGTLSDISLTGSAQWDVLDSYNRPWDLDYNKNDTAVTVFRRNAKACPDKTAAVYRDRRYTYRELDELTDRLAAKLYRKACAITGKTSLAEEVVSILLPRDENVFILPMAAVKAGLAYEPLDPSYPRERLNFMVKDAGACLLLAEESLLELVDEYTGAVLTVNELYAMEDVPDVPVPPKPEDLFIMLYTSGSTGVPKGCQIVHSNLVSYAHGVRNDFYRADDRIAAYASFGFDVNMSDVFCTLLNGGTVCLIPEDIRMNLDALAAYFDEAGITALLLTTQVGVQFLQSYPKLRTLRMLVMGGEKLPAVDPSRLSYTIVNGYGPTENCCGVSLFPIEAWEPNIPIGKPMASIHGYILDKTGHRLPAGAAGEYCLSGPQVSRGYLNRPDKTAEAYEPCPFNEFRMYHTGDIVRYRQNGDVEFVGRKDGQVKIRGFRIETKEVEAVIRGFAGIRDVTVQAYDFETGGKYLAAFVVSDESVDTAALADFIRSQKPAYMVPPVIMQIEAIPLTVNQKVDKKALPKPNLQKAEYVAPEGKAEEDFCAIFAKALGLGRVSAEDDFFEVGGNSILAMKVVLAAANAGYDIVYNDVFENTTPRALAAFAGGRHAEASAPATAGDAQETQATAETGRDGYDYRPIHALLSRNTMDAFRKGARLPLNDVLLLGGTGYLGSHVLHELIVHHTNQLYCFVRPGKDMGGEARLKATLRSYFGEDYAELFGERIHVIEGDATDPGALSRFEAPSEDMTVINCAASVKHFAKGDEIERANVHSVRNLAQWCERSGARLVHISTCSVTGSRENGMPPVGDRLDEHRLFNGQEIESNKYVHSKYMAERHIYEEILTHGLRAKVLRVGNLAPRAEDGAFQINYQTNSFMKAFRAYAALGVISYDALDVSTEFSPIDCLAVAVLKLATTPEDCVCFMLLNAHRPLNGDVIRELNAMGHAIRGAEPEAFVGALREALTDEARSEAVSSLIAYQNSDNIRTIGLEGCDTAYTTRVLERLGYSWPETGSAYIRRFLTQLEKKGFFG